MLARPIARIHSVCNTNSICSYLPWRAIGFTVVRACMHVDMHVCEHVWCEHVWIQIHESWPNTNTHMRVRVRAFQFACMSMCLRICVCDGMQCIYMQGMWSLAACTACFAFVHFCRLKWRVNAYDWSDVWMRRCSVQEDIRISYSNTCRRVNVCGSVCVCMHIHTNTATSLHISSIVYLRVRARRHTRLHSSRTRVMRSYSQGHAYVANLTHIQTHTCPEHRWRYKLMYHMRAHTHT